MFFRLKQSPSGRVLQLLESYRNPEGQPRHRVVISLGDAALAQADWKTVAGAVSAELYGQKPLLPPELSTNAIDQRPKVDRFDYPARDTGGTLASVTASAQRSPSRESGWGVGGPSHSRSERSAGTRFVG